ncbi:hypothetical protein M758_UG080600 [Ceratodon purpureus]|nr:hypothetical protein M758_UG080600 [Ceratodon purpureus]
MKAMQKGFLLLLAERIDVWVHLSTPCVYRNGFVEDGPIESSLLSRPGRAPYVLPHHLKGLRKKAMPFVGDSHGDCNELGSKPALFGCVS